MSNLTQLLVHLFLNIESLGEKNMHLNVKCLIVLIISPNYPDEIQERENVNKLDLWTECE